MTCVKSVYNNDQTILRGIMLLHLDDEPFEADVTYSTGGFYRDGIVPEPTKWRSDLVPQVPGVVAADCRALPLADGSLSSMVVDLPFNFGSHGTNNPNNKVVRGPTCPTSSNIRFSQFASFEQLRSTYRATLAEAARVLRSKGVLALKIADMTDKRSTWTHCEVWLWAQAAGFYPKDLFVRTVASGRAYNPALVQRHSRKHQSFWWVFVKERKAAP
jgi:hypothetical protein